MPKILLNVTFYTNKISPAAMAACSTCLSSLVSTESLTLKHQPFCSYLFIYLLQHLSTVIFDFVQVTSDVSQLLGEQKVDAILCVAGGWAGGNCSSKGQNERVPYQ